MVGMCAFTVFLQYSFIHCKLIHKLQADGVVLVRWKKQPTEPRAEPPKYSALNPSLVWRLQRTSNTLHYAPTL